MFGILNFLLFGLDFESYLIKLICISSGISLHLGGVCFFDFLLKAICFQNLNCLFFYFFISYYKLFTK